MSEVEDGAGDAVDEPVVSTTVEVGSELVEVGVAVCVAEEGGGLAVVVSGAADEVVVCEVGELGLAAIPDPPSGWPAQKPAERKAKTLSAVAPHCDLLHSRIAEENTGLVQKQGAALASWHFRSENLFRTSFVQVSIHAGGA